MTFDYCVQSEQVAEEAAPEAAERVKAPRHRERRASSGAHGFDT